jgi:hypothetical protein
LRYGITNSNINSSCTIAREVGIRGKNFTVGVKENLSQDSLSQIDYHTRTSSISISTTPVSLLYAYKQKLGNQPRVVDLGNLKISFGIKEFFFIDLAYELTSLERKIFNVEYYKVAPGEGSFSRDSISGTYFPDPHGDYEKRYVYSNELGIYKDFNLSHKFILRLNKEISFRFSTFKEGEGNRIYFWKRVEDALEDKNSITIGAWVFDIYTEYIKKDYRTNKVGKIMGSGINEVFQFNFYPKPFELKYIASHNRNWESFNLIWDEYAITLGGGVNFNLFFLSSHFVVQGEERKIYSFPYPSSHFYGYSIEPSSAYQIKNKRIEVRFKLTYWDLDQKAPPNIKVSYPPGISSQWGIDFIIFSQGKTDYTLSYQGNKTPNYPTDHTLNAEVRIHF